MDRRSSSKNEGRRILKGIPLDSRYGMIADIEETWIRKDLSQPENRAAAKAAVKKIIEETQARR